MSAAKNALPMTPVHMSYERWCEIVDRDENFACQLWTARENSRVTPRTTSDFVAGTTLKDFLKKNPPEECTDRSHDMDESTTVSSSPTFGYEDEIPSISL